MAETEKKAAAVEAAAEEVKPAKKPAAKKPAAKKAEGETAEKKPAAKKAEGETAEKKPAAKKPAAQKAAKPAGVTVRLVKSLSGRSDKQIATAASLGLRKIGDTAVQPDNAQTAGKIAKIAHMVTVTKA